MSRNDTDAHETGPEMGTDDGWATDIDPDSAARGTVYATLARAFADPDEEFYRAVRDGTVTRLFADLLDRTPLEVDPPTVSTGDDHDTLRARYTDLFVVGFSRVVDRTDGTIEGRSPPVSLYESDYRTEVSWSDVNLDLARAYEYFGVGIDEDRRENHDNLRLQLQFAGYLCRREAAVDESAAAARLDFLDRHLGVVAGGVAEALADEAGTGLYGDLGGFLDAFVRADTDDLAARLDREGSS